MNVAIIGSNGLLSDKIALYCIGQGYSLTMYGLEKPRNIEAPRFVAVDLLDRSLDAQELARYDAIVYASGAGIQSNLKESNELVFKLNTFVPIELCNSLSQVGYRGVFVTFGSYFEIGSTARETKYTESDLVASRSEVPNAYSVSKRLLSRYVDSTRQTFRHLHLVLPTIYGPTEAPHRLIPYTINALKNGEPLQFTAGTQVRQYLYIDDLPRIVFGLAEIIGRSDIVNISGTDTLTVRQVVELIFEMYGRRISDELFGKAERADISMLNLQLDDSKLRSLLPGISYTPFREVIKLY